ncbi:GlxA family transcriptional regulator [Pseudomonas coleopterorum]|uniref:GlxA family transcriptional regulator n=1 Tax=Pseudomonas coleopterorum TaxID=1605838 RepID=UPI00177C10E5|nr:helix-turn-helix domain-containing protein [Pseudomonas coleopterorum]MBD8481405.1 helix-turn-helix domain-containing protein [Pseudomonas coleopterorum]
MRTKLIQFVTFSNMNLLDFAGPFEVFQTANFYAKTQKPPYTLQIVSFSGSALLCEAATLHTAEVDTKLTTPHTLVIPGGPGIYDFCKGPKFKTDFVSHAQKAERLVSVCTGVFALAAADMLHGKNVTTHWLAYEELEQQYPHIILRKGPIFLNDEKIWTSAGVTSGIDLCLSIVEKDLGHSAALEIARHLVMFLKRPGDQNQFSSSLTLQMRSGEFSDLHAWVNSNLNNDLSIGMLAERMNMSERTLMRKYKASTGQTPNRMVETLRLESVRHLLVTSNRPLKEIAAATGMGGDANLIRRFAKAFGTTPNEYRARFTSSD